MTLSNPPNIRDGRVRLVVTARDKLPKAFIWKLVSDDGKGKQVVHKTSEPTAFLTMDAAYTAGRNQGK